MTPLDQLTAALAGRYEVEREIGAGGMATVYLARDVKHNRKVALKVLKPELGAVLGVERFLSEIQVTANLQHPNLLPLFDSGEANGLLFYVMPFVEGESLRARLDREKQLPVDEAVRLAVAIAGALDYAHEHGVIHRDLKPENILLQAGQPVIADFGIALAVSNAGGARVTQTGLSLGTPQYMSPEQATGDRVIDARSDIYSLSAMVYEMLVGDPPHLGSTAQAIVAKVLTERPPSVLVARPAVGDAVAHAIERGLEKLPADRWSSAAEFSDALRGKVSTGAMRSRTRATMAGSAAGAAVPRWMRVALASTTLVAVVALGAAAWFATRPEPKPPASRFELGLPDSVTLYTGGGTKLAFSRDGTKLVLVGVKDGKRALYLRRMEDPLAQPVRGGDLVSATGNASPSFSPDGDWIVYEVDRVVKKIPTAGGTPQTLADSAGGASWGDRGTLVYQSAGSLWIGTAEGHDGRLLARADTSEGVRGLNWPEVLPGAEYALVTLNSARGNVVDSMRLGVVSLKTGVVTDLGQHGTNAHYVPSGHIVFGRAGGLVFVAPFSLGKRALTGPPSLLLENVWQGSGGATGFTLSHNGALAYHLGTQGAGRNLVIVDRSGAIRRTVGEKLVYSLPRLSPDGRRIAADVAPTDQPSVRGVALIDVGTGGRERLVADDSGRGPEWTRDGARVVFFRRSGGKEEFVARARDRSRPDSVLVSDTFTGFIGARTPVLGAPRGLAAFHMTGASSGRRGVYVTPMDSMGRYRPFATGSSNNHSPVISADGRLIAWVSDETGTEEVYAQPIPGPGGRVKVSVGGGSEPVWARTGGTLFYRGPARMMSAQVEGTPLGVGRRDSLFVDPFLRLRISGRNWDLFPNGSEFLMVAAQRSTTDGVFVVLNWQQLKAAPRGGEPEP